MPFKNIEEKRKYHREYNKKYRKLFPEKERQNRKNHYDNLKLKNPNYHKEFYIKNRDKILARVKKSQKDNPIEWKVNQITRWSYIKEYKCEICGNNKNLEFHHWIYKLPVEKKHFNTLCKECHWIQHSKRRLE